MGRERYQTKEDLKRENKIAAGALKRWPEYHAEAKIPDRYNSDRAFFHKVLNEETGELESLIGLYVEIKYRGLRKEKPEAKGLKFGHGNGYWISQEKVERAWVVKQTTGINTRLVVCFLDDVVKWTDMRWHGGEVVIGGPIPPRDDQDHEPEVIFRWSAFQDFPPLPT